MKPKISYIICASPRSGSHLLGEALQNTGVAGVPDEYFHSDAQGHLQNQTGGIAEQYGQKTLEEFQDLVLELGSTPNGVFGVKISPFHLTDIVKNYQTLPQYKNLEAFELLETLLYEPKYIWLTRRDKVRQAVSWFKAEQTNIWRKTQASQTNLKQQPTFDYIGIETCRLRIENAEQYWQTYFKEHNITPFKVIYEDLVEAYEETALKILEFLGIPHPETLSFSNRQLQKQSNSINDEWVKKYRNIQNTRFPKITLFILKLRWKLGKITVRRWLRMLVGGK